MSCAPRDWSGWTKEGCSSQLPTCCTGSCVMVLLVQPFLHLEITGVGRKRSQTCSDPARKALFDVNRLWSKSGSTSGEALLLLFVSQPGQAFPRVSIFHFPCPSFPHTCWCVGMKQMQLLVAGLDVGLVAHPLGQQTQGQTMAVPTAKWSSHIKLSF